jgi:hypothetical protein
MSAALFAFGVAAERRVDDHEEERLYRLDLESAPVVLAAVIVSIVLAVGVWRDLRGRGWRVGLPGRRPHVDRPRRRRRQPSSVAAWSGT